MSYRNEFEDCKSNQRLSVHREFLRPIFPDLVDVSNEGRGLRDFYSPSKDCWIEAKTEPNNGTGQGHRLLIEWRSNVNLSWLPVNKLNLLKRKGEEYDQDRLLFGQTLRQRIDALPEFNSYNNTTLALGTAPLEPNHLLSYYAEAERAIYLIDLHKLRERMEETRPPVMGCVHNNWKCNIAMLPRIKDLGDLWLRKFSMGELCQR